MKRLNLFLLAFALITGTSIWAAPFEKANDLKELSEEIEHTLRDSNHDIKKGTTVTVFFSISEDKKIQCISVASSEVEVSELIQEKFKNYELHGEIWREGLVYELSVGHLPPSIPCPYS